MAQKARPEAYGAGQLTPPILVRCFPFHRVRLRSFILNKRRVLYYVPCRVTSAAARGVPTRILRGAAYALFIAFTAPYAVPGA